MGTITRALANNITTGGVVASSGVSNTSVSAITSLPSGIELNDTFQLISTQTASSSSSLSFTSGLDSTYDVYCFRYFDIHPGTDNVNFSFQGSTNGGSSYGVTITSTAYRARHNEADTATDLIYTTGGDLAQSTSYQPAAVTIGADSDQSTSGELWLFRPDSTTQVKHFVGRSVIAYYADFIYEITISGYFNTTSAVNAIDFKMSSGNIDSGTIKLFGVRDVTTAGI